MPAIALAWSGGKDSALALLALREELGVEPRALITTVAQDGGRVTMHGVRGELLRRQARAAGLPLVEIPLPQPCPDDVYAARMAGALASEALAGVEAVAFGDLFLEDIRAYREERLAAAGRRALFPLWGRDTGELARTFLARAFQATVVCVDTERLDPSFAGRPYDDRLLADLPAGVDPCGEHGELHTFVHDGPVFDRAITCATGAVSEQDRFARCDLHLAPGP